MAGHNATASLVIANGGTKSASLGDFWGANPAKVALDSMAKVTIQGPAALTGVVTVQVAQVSPAADGDFVALQSGGADVTIPAAKATNLPVFTAKDLRLVSAGAEGAARTFLVTLQEDTAT